MPQPIQDANLSDRLRRFFKLRGRTSFQLDETVVPIVVIEDLSGPYYPLKSIFARGVGNQNVLVPTNTFPSQVALYFDSFIDFPGVNLVRPGIFTVDSIGIYLSFETIKSLGVADAIEFRIQLSERASLSLGTSPPPDSESGMVQASQWQILDAGRKRIPIFIGTWGEKGISSLSGTTVAKITLGIGGAGAPLAGGLATGLGIALNSACAISIGPDAATQSTPALDGIKFMVNFAGHYEPEADTTVSSST